MLLTSRPAPKATRAAHGVRRAFAVADLQTSCVRDRLWCSGTLQTGSHIILTTAKLRNALQHCMWSHRPSRQTHGRWIALETKASLSADGEPHKFGAYICCVQFEVSARSSRTNRRTFCPWRMVFGRDGASVMLAERLCGPDLLAVEHPLDRG